MRSISKPTGTFFPCSMCFECDSEQAWIPRCFLGEAIGPMSQRQTLGGRMREDWRGQDERPVEHWARGAVCALLPPSRKERQPPRPLTSQSHKETTPSRSWTQGQHVLGLSWCQKSWSQADVVGERLCSMNPDPVPLCTSFSLLVERSLRIMPPELSQ